MTVHRLAAGASGAPLVAFVHGLEDSWTSWRPAAARLDPAWRAVALDLPWRAGNDYRWRHRRPADWLRDALHRLGEVPDVLVAHSFGATAALTLACAGERVAGRALALVCPLYRRPDRPVTWRTLDEARGSFERNIRDGVAARLGGRVAGLDGTVREAIGDVAFARVAPAAFLAVFDEFVRSAELPLGALAVPARVMAAAADPTLSRGGAAALRAGLPRGSSVRVRTDHDHFCHVRHPHDVAAEVTGLLARTSAPPRTGDAA